MQYLLGLVQRGRSHLRFALQPRIPLRLHETLVGRGKHMLSGLQTMSLQGQGYCRYVFNGLRNRN